MKKRPKYLNLLQIRLPIAGIVSLAHRLSGAFLVFLIPFLIYGLDLSLASEASFLQIQRITTNTFFFKILGFVILWAICHHFFAGIRFILLDLHIGVEKQQASISAVIAGICGLALALLFAGVLL